MALPRHPAVAVAAVASLLIHVGASLSIQSHDGWYMAWAKGENIPSSDSAIEWRQFNGSWFRCWMGTLLEEPDPDGYSTWTPHRVDRDSNRYIYVHKGAKKTHFLVATWNQTRMATDIRVCIPRSVAPKGGNCGTKHIDESDCPLKCLWNHTKTKGKTRCELKGWSTDCTSDLRCVPTAVVASNPTGTHPLRLEGGRCLAAHFGKIEAETCSATAASQQWSFKDSATVLV